MAFYYTADTVDVVKSVGVLTQLVSGSVVLSGGSATVTIANARLVKMAIASSQTANAARVSATSGNTFTITGTGTDRVDYIAVVVIQ